MKVLVTGASGQLGYDVCRELKTRGIDFYGTSSAELDITDETAVERTLAEYRPDAVIHCAAWTAVDKAETNEKAVMVVNAEGTRNIALACRAVDAKLLYLSTDYVFPGTGDRCYEVGDPTGPISVYGWSKLAGELAVRELTEKFFIIRVSWVFGKNGGNFVQTMLRLAQTRGEINVVCDQIGSPTYTADLAPLLCDMARTEQYGIYHATNEGLCSWADFAQEIFRLVGTETVVHPIPTSAYPTAAARPLNSRLSKASLDAAGFPRLPPWQDALARYLNEEESAL